MLKSANHFGALYRKRVCIKNVSDSHDIVIDNQRCVNFSSNDYLSLKHDQRIKAALIDGINLYGNGSGGSPLVCGYQAPHKLFEEHISSYYGKQAALIFTSGYSANKGVISALTHEISSFYVDRECHASIYDGLISRKNTKIYRYQQSPLGLMIPEKHGGIISESIFSISGRQVNISELCLFKKLSNGLLYIDDAHGAGVIERDNLSQFKDVDIINLPLGKAFNASGAVICADKDVIDVITQRCRSYTYSTSMPAYQAYALCETLKIVQTEVWRRQRLNQLIRFFTAYAKHLCLRLFPSLSPIQSIIIGNSQKVLKMQQYLIQNGFYCVAMRPPTVAKGKDCLRITINHHHKQQQIEKLLNLISAYEVTKH